MTRIFSFGGGVQSVAVLVLQAQGKLKQPFDEFVFANVGADSENPLTLDYLAEFVQPYAARHGIKLSEVQKHRRNGDPDTLLTALYRVNRSVPIPIYMPQGSKSKRSCTVDFKVKVIDQYIRQLKHERAEIGIGFSTDETRRLHGREPGWHDHHKKYKFGFQKRFVYPLLENQLSRHACAALIAAEGLPVPPKSSCWFCPFMKRNERIEQKRHTPELFDATCQLEDMINEKRQRMGRDRVFIHPDLVPMRNAVGEQSTMLNTWFDDLECSEGYCGL